ncbi:MAG: hypothetical protein ABJN34_17480 [Litoreibacter sp.]|uniref:hypothetical protein n=1 Tax=Litoreibacter sp. TaxID=1969459 RepID=UPI003296A5AF
MKHLLRILGRVSIFISCLFIAIAIARVNERDRALVDEGLLPTPVGHSYQKPTFANKVSAELITVRLEFLSSVFPNFVPAQDRSIPMNPNRLEALKQRSSQSVLY